MQVARIAFLAIVLSAGAAAQVPLIFDTDMGNDIDDALALAMIHSLERRGACRLLAVTSTKDHELSAAFIDALNTFYDAPGVPIGAVRDGVTPQLGRYLAVADETDDEGRAKYPHDLTSGNEAPEAVSLLRKTLAAQPDGSVSIVQVGFFTNMARLLDSGPDEHSPLAGPALVERKVSELVVMAGAFQTVRFQTRYLEYNAKIDVAATKKVAAEWPTPIVWSGFEIGIAATYPWKSIVEDFSYEEHHIVRDSYLSWSSNEPHDRPTWDLTAVLYAVYRDRAYFGQSAPGSVVVGDDGGTDFHPRDDGKSRYLLMGAEQAVRVREAFVQLVSEPPPTVF